ncbi:MAG: phosphopentomutase [Actinomycetota bacterium]|nr:phosphopentomutase [Actinomycetota bacterium]
MPTGNDKRLFDRSIVIILDGLGVGELDDAKDYGDAGSNTLANTAKAVGGFSLPNLERLGLGRIIDIEGVLAVLTPEGSFGKMAEISAGKDSTSGHLEMMGLPIEKPFPVYPKGFPSEIISSFEERIGRRVLCNRPASGTEVIKEFGEEHLKTKRPIVYTSADSVFQIAAHKDVCPVEELYEMCRKARDLLRGKDEVCRVIARPFAGEIGGFYRTPERRDFSLEPFGKTALDYAVASGLSVFGVGKISEIFMGRGISESIHADSNMDGIDKILSLIERGERGIILANLVDFDMLWGHRNDPLGFAKGLEAVDARIPEIMSCLKENDALFFSADHGCDPTTESTDHSREHVPLLACGERIEAGIDIGIRKSFADLGKTISELLDFEADILGESFASLIAPSLKGVIEA